MCSKSFPHQLSGGMRQRRDHRARHRLRARVHHRRRADHRARRAGAAGRAGADQGGAGAHAAPRSSSSPTTCRCMPRSPTGSASCMPGGWSRRGRRTDVFAQAAASLYRPPDRQPAAHRRRRASARACRASRPTSPIRRRGCRFHPRCPLAIERCTQGSPADAAERDRRPRRLLPRRGGARSHERAPRTRPRHQALSDRRALLAPQDEGGQRRQLYASSADKPEIFAIVGESPAAARRRIAKMILGNERPTSGSIRFDGADVGGDPDARRRARRSWPRCSRSSRTRSRRSTR